MTYDSSDILTIMDLQNLAKSGLIEKDVVTRGEQLCELSGVEIIKGSLGISDSSLESLGDLIEITEDFWMSSHTVYSRMTSLGQLQKVGGDLSLRYSNIEDLGDLQEVGGKLSLRDTPIEDLGALKYVGGDLYLPKRLEDQVDLTQITIKGKTRFWNDNKLKRTIVPKEQLGLNKYSQAVPFWKHQYIYSRDDLSNASREQLQFYKAFKREFRNGNYLDIEGNDNYAFVLFYDLLNEHENNRDFSTLNSLLEQLKMHYPKTSSYIEHSIIKRHEGQGNYENAWNLLYEETYIGIQTVIEYEKKLNRKLLDGELMSKMAGISHLTEFGQNNIDQIKPFASDCLEEMEKKQEKDFFSLFFKDIEFSLFPQAYYKQFYVAESEYLHYKAIDDSQEKLSFRSPITHVVEKAIFNQFRILLKKAEDLYRESIGVPKIGEGWISETELYYLIADSFPEHNVIQHGSPIWLGRQHLDIYFPELNIGLEYQGAQHYVAIDFFGGEEALEKTKERDKIKKQKCQDNGCHLIYVQEGYDFENIKNKIEITINGVQQILK